MAPPSPLIFVNTDNTDPDNKLFIATMAGGAAGKAEALMQKIVKDTYDKEKGFTTKPFDKAKGYSIRLTVTKVTVAEHKTTCTISGALVRWPEEQTKKRGKGEAMVSIGDWSSTATTDGTSDYSLMQCIEANTEGMAAKAVKPMQQDFANR